MKLIKIKRKSLKKNPTAGNTISTVFGNKEASFTCTQKIPDKFKTLVFITSETLNGDYKCTGIIINPNEYDKLLKIKGIAIEVNNHLEKIYHKPEAKYFFEYENPSLVCENCKSKIKYKEIEEECDDDGNHYTVCPKCQSQNSFEDLEFEKVEDVALKLGL